MLLSQLTCDNPKCSCRRAAERGRGLVHCPAHDDSTPSLSVAQDGDLFHCFAGCTQAEVIAALRARGLWPEKRRPKLGHRRQKRQSELLRAAALWQRGLILRLEAARRDAWHRFIEAEALADDAGQRQAATDLLLLAARQRRVAAPHGGDLITAYLEARKRFPRTVARLIKDAQQEQAEVHQSAAAWVGILAAAQQIASGGNKRASAS